MNRKVWGHRGCRGAGNPPENSITAFQLAADCGVGGIELDIHLSLDGVPVVFHDTTLKRMTGAAGELSMLALAEIKKLRLLSANGVATKDTIPTLEEVLESLTARRQSAPFVVNIELKDPRSATAVADLLNRSFTKGWTPENFLISSFDMACLREMKTLAPDLPLGTLFECAPEDLAKNIERTADLKPATINVPISCLTSSTLDLIQSQNAKAVVWTPNEINPNRLSNEDRETLLKRLREWEFVVITDFPKELLLLLKPNKARATATGVLAACLSYSQQEMLFRPTESGLEKLKSPAEYPELTRFGFSDLQLTAEDGVSFMVWERNGSLDRPHFLLFHGNRAHWGDTGVGEKQRDRRARLKFIAELASSGAGVTAVTLRGFGGSAAMPSELGFLRDLRAVAHYVANSRINHRRLVVAGESLGTWAATQMAVYLTQRNSPPVLLSLQNPFTCMAEVGEQVVSHLPLVRSLNIGISASALDRHVLKNHFYTASLLGQLCADTALHIATSGKDTLVNPSHSDKLAEIARKNDLRITRDLFPEALHSTIPPVEFARRLISVGVESCGVTSDSGVLWGDPPRPIVIPVDHMPY